MAILLLVLLYLIEILHQTTTNLSILIGCSRLYLIEILHQTTTQSTVSRNAAGCILSKFYIKPQHYNFEKRINYVVSYRNSTSNHNDVRSNPLAVPVVSYRNSTSNHNVADDYVTSAKVVSYRNSTSNHNSRAAGTISAGVVSYRNSTSNHNNRRSNYNRILLYLIEILHQTTTLEILTDEDILLYLIEILHQTTTA